MGTSRVLRSSLAATSLGLALVVAPVAARAGTCPVPECVPGEIVANEIPPNAPGIPYRAVVGKYVAPPFDGGGEPVPPRYFSPNLEILDDTGFVVESSLQDDLADPTYKTVSPAGGLRPNKTYKVRFDKDCATGSTPMPTATGEVKTLDAKPLPRNVGTLEVVEKKVEMRDIPNTADGGTCTVKKEVSVVKIRFKPSDELKPFAKMVGYRATLDGNENGPLRYQVGQPDGTYETDVFVPCPTEARTLKAEVLARVMGTSVNPQPATLDVPVLACGAGVGGGDAGDGGAGANAASSGCSCDTAGEGGSMTGFTFATAALGLVMVVRGVARRRERR